MRLLIVCAPPSHQESVRGLDERILDDSESVGESVPGTVRNAGGPLFMQVTKPHLFVLDENEETSIALVRIWVSNPI
jgi:hypothetical protein